jgi:peptidyl-prolyl cis-trans isomerase D
VLDLMRKNARSWVIKAILAGVAITFIFMYGAPERGHEGDRTAAEVNGSVITYDEFYNTYQRQLDEIKMRFQGAIPEGTIEKMNLKKRVLDSMVHQALLIQEAARLGLFVTEDDLVRDIKSNPMFQRDGLFSEQIYRAFLSSVKFSVAGYESMRRQELLEEQVTRVLADGIKTDPKEIKDFWHFENDKLRLTYIVIGPEPTPPGQVIDKKDLDEFFDKNREKYEIPESVDLETVVFSWKDVAKKVTIPDEEVLSYYKNNPKEFAIPEKFKLRHILISVAPDAGEAVEVAARNTAEKIRERTQKGENFEALAQSESQDKETASKGGELGLFAVGSIAPEFESVVKDLKPGEISQPVRTAMGYHILKVDEIKPEGAFTFDEVKQKILDSLVEKKARTQVDDEAEQLYELVYRSENLDGPAQKFGFPIRKVQRVTKSGGIPELGKSQEVLDEAFQLKDGEISKLVRSGDFFSLVKIEKKTPARIPELQEIKDAVEKDFSADQALAGARKKAEQVIAELKKNPKDYDDVAKKFGLAWKDLDPVSRTSGLIPQLGSAPEIREMMVTVSTSAPLFPAPVPIPDGIGIVRLARLEPATDAAYEQGAPEFRRRGDRIRRTEFVQGWLKVLEEQSKIKINDKML